MSCYYNANATKFLEDTLGANMDTLYEAFTKRLPQKAVILDAGCGSGRDSLYFKNLGHFIIAMDASQEMCQFAGEYIGQSVLLCRFQEMHFKVLFDGIWACASLLHVPSNEIVSVLQRFNWYLKDDGIMYASFKYGDFEGEREGRYYLDLTEETATKFFTEAGFRIEKMWITNDVRADRVDEKWLNVLVNKNI
ncbi:MAG: class I SAM-dependent methyltransferase [Candidatus Cellulosilyticum pullistercoris]|uniref:Class I SAM-dependent methyltransferase n=1 Tax=Candidatus Cellulosilyticum pullistercoris TaxID=2838521 RepID=A0A9E2KDP4_9FIRM|nr:class I SAM-dependent methyltransferase [Candidatus Cellulosilyticum pullistercoris]